MRWLPAAAALLIVCGCVPAEKKTVETPGGNITIEKEHGGARVSASGTDEIVEIQPGEVMKKLDLPLYPGARVVEGSQYHAISKKRGDQTYSARLEAAAPFEDVRDWYQKRIGSKPVTVSVAGKRTSLVAKTDHATGKTRTVMLSAKRESKETDITLVLVIGGPRID